MYRRRGRDVTESCHCEPPEQEDHAFGCTERGCGNLAVIIRSRKKGEIATVASSLAMTHTTNAHIPKSIDPTSRPYAGYSQIAEARYPYFPVNNLPELPK